MTIELDDAERDLLKRLLDQAVSDVRTGVRRSRTPDFHDGLVAEEEIIKGLLEKIGAA